MDGKKWQKKWMAKKNEWQKMAKNGMAKNMDGKKIPEYESSPVKNCWVPMTPVKNWA